jgi:hypothetical protein
LSRTIWKTALKTEKTQVIEVPEDWRPLRFDNQKGDPTIWYECDPTSPKKQRVIFTVFTGETVPDGARYIGTATFGANDFLVVHCYYTQ